MEMIPVFRRLLNLFQRKRTEERGELLRVGGRMIDTRDWSPKVLEEIRQEFFMPNLKNAALIRVDLSAACPEGHMTTERIGLFCNKGDVAKKVTDDLHKIRVKLQCKECGKLSQINGRHIAWSGDIGQWDGAT